MRHVYSALAVGAGLFVLGSLAPVWLTVSALVLSTTVGVASWSARRSCANYPVEWRAEVHHTVHHVHHVAAPPQLPVVQGHISQPRVVQGQVVAPSRRSIAS